MMVPHQIDEMLIFLCYSIFMFDIPSFLLFLLMAWRRIISNEDVFRNEYQL